MPFYEAKKMYTGSLRNKERMKNIRPSRHFVATFGTSVNSVKDILGLRFDISKKIRDQFVILPKRWIVECTLSWLGASGRLSKDFEILTGISENIIRIANIKITLAKCA